MARKSYFRSQAHPLRQEPDAGRVVALGALSALIVLAFLVVILSAFGYPVAGV